MIFANPGPGIGPVIRVLDLAEKVRFKSGCDSKILMPWLYGEKQVRILKEELQNSSINADEVLLSEDLGKIINSFFDRWSSFEQIISLFSNIL